MEHPDAAERAVRGYLPRSVLDKIKVKIPTLQNQGWGTQRREISLCAGRSFDSAQDRLLSQE
jgi:hypothetical protein